MARTVARVAKALFPARLPIRTEETSQLRNSGHITASGLTKLKSATSEEIALVFRFMKLGDPSNKGLTKEKCVRMLEQIDLAPNVIRQIVDLSLPNDDSPVIWKCVFEGLRLVGHAQHGRRPTAQLKSTPGPLAKLTSIYVDSEDPPNVSIDASKEGDFQEALALLRVVAPGRNTDDLAHVKAHLQEQPVGLLDHILRLEGSEALAFQNFIDHMIMKEPQGSPWATELHRWMRKLACHSGVLPDSLFLRDVQKIDEYPVACGGFADVYRGAFGDSEVALKVLRFFPSEKQRNKCFREFCQEALFWRQLRHEHIAPFLGLSAALFAPRLCFVSPWMGNGNVMQYIDNRSDADRLALLHQAAKGLLYLHEFDPSLVHGDIKGANILVNDVEEACLSDLGLISMAESHLHRTTYTSNSEAGSIRWMAPELLKEGKRKCESTDVYAFGLTMIEVLSGKTPFRTYSSDMSVMHAVLKGERPSRPSPLIKAEGSNDEVWKLVKSCWAHDSDSRPSMREVVGRIDQCRPAGVHIAITLVDSDLES